jgi:hypothetical protein
MQVKSFSARISKLGINRCVNVPEDVLDELFRRAARNKGPIPVRGTLNGKKFKQTVVKYQGAWRLYLNTQMRKDAGIDAGDIAKVVLEFDPKPRIIPMNQKLARSLSKNSEAKAAFQKLAPSHQKEILLYLDSIKTEESLVRNVEKVIQHFLGKKLNIRYA